MARSSLHRGTRSAPIPPPPPDLPNAEAEVLALVRRLRGATTREVCDGLAGQRKIGMSATQALLLRLEAKGLLAREKIRGTKAYRYVPTLAAEPTYRQLARRFLDRIFGGNPVQLMATLFEGREPTVQQIEELRKLLDENVHHRGRGARREEPMRQDEQDRQD